MKLRLSPTDRVNLAIAVLWALECWLVQNVTLKPDIGGEEVDLILSAVRRGALRFGFDLLAGAALVYLLPRRWLPGVFIGSALVSLSVLTFFDYFTEPLTWSIASRQAAEGVEASSAIPLLLHHWWTVAILAFLVLKIFLWRYGGGSDLSRAANPKLGLRLLACYLAALFTFMVMWPIGKLKTWHSFSYTASACGYTPVWLAEIFILDNASLLRRANLAAQQKSDLFQNVPLLVEAPVRVVTLQLESLDFEAVDTQVADGPLMPFLGRFREQVAFTAIAPIHLTGSSDADFTFLLAARPNGVVAPYKVAGFDYSSSIVGLAHRHGYRTEAFHGNRGSFFSRRAAFRQMGFDALNFAEEMQARFEGESYWGIPDDAVLDIAGERIRAGPVPSLSVLIMLTTHTPYRFLVPGRRELFPQPDSAVERYFNNMRYLDRCLEKFIGELPDGTLAFIYSDHTSRLAYPRAPGGQPAASTTVPFIVFVKGVGSKSLQPYFDAVEGRNPTLLDAASYFHRYFDIQQSPAQRG